MNRLYREQEVESLRAEGRDKERSFALKENGVVSGVDCKRIFKIDVYVPLSKRKSMTQERETEAMFSSKQKRIASGAQVEGLDLSKSSSKLTREKTKYTGTNVDGWVDVVTGA